jgi:hypothetical protein
MHAIERTHAVSHGIRVAAVAALAACALLLVADRASAATSVGQLFTPMDGCAANSIQLQTGVASGNAYTVPSDGVITSWAVQLQNMMFGGLRLVVAGPSVGGSHTIVGGAAAGTQVTNSVNRYFARVPVTAGDEIGIFVGSGGNCLLMSGVGADHVDVHAGDLATGASDMFTQVTGEKVPVSATVEPDADHDGYGDETQDSCPSEATVHFGPCTGGATRVGQTFTPVSGPCDQGTYIQTSVSGGTTYTVPTAGVLTSWSVEAPEAPNADPVGFRIFRPTGAPHTYTVIGDSPLESVAGGSGLLSFPTRVAVQPGDLLGLYSEGNSGWCGNYPLAPGDSWDYANVTSQPPGSQFTYTAEPLFLRADIAASLEPDRDGDGFGDLTQDACPTDPTRQTACPPPPPARAASLSRVSQSASRWREGKTFARLSRRARKPPVGTTFRFTLDKAATVRFVFTQKKPGRRVGGECRAPSARNKGRSKCTRTVTAGKLSFARAHAGANRVRFAGRLSRKQKLRAGRYTLTITASNGPGLVSAPKRLTFTIVR